MKTRLRRGNYIMLFLVGVLVFLGFGAFTVDLGYMWMARAQAQDVADAAAQAALVVLRQTGNTETAEDAAEAVVAANEVAGEPPELMSIGFGVWDDTLDDPEFEADAERPNAVRVEVGRRDGQSIPYLLARLWGYDTFQVRARATAATRSVQLVLVLDITGSWEERRFANAREAVLLAHDMLTTSSSALDEVGMTIFTNRYAWEYTPFSFIADATTAEEMRDAWEVLNIASKAGTNADPYDGVACTSSGNNFNSPPGGCYPDMPREYLDESGTDHSTGILLAKEMFEEAESAARYRAMIVITDGTPADLKSISGNTRAAQGYVETRWREYVGPVPRSVSAIRTASIDATTDLWDELGVNTWAVSLVYDDPILTGMVQGDGYRVVTNDSAQLGAIIAQIISELPLALVE
jgi:hypothetical protein